MIRPLDSLRSLEVKIISLSEVEGLQLTSI